MLHVCATLWQPNDRSQKFSLCYDESWVNKLHAGFCRNLTRPFRFVVFTDRQRKFADGIEQERLATEVPHYGCLIEPFRLNEPMIMCGLDTVVLRNIDHLADYCLNARRMALPRNPYDLKISINPVALVPSGYRHVYDNWRGENDMDWLRQHQCAFIDDIWPGQVLSLKAHDVRRKGTQDARIVYFHGEPKPPSLMHLDWVREHWRG